MLMWDQKPPPRWESNKLLGGIKNGETVAPPPGLTYLEIASFEPVQPFVTEDYAPYSARFERHVYTQREWGSAAGTLKFWADQRLTNEEAEKKLWYRFMRSIGARRCEDS